MALLRTPVLSLTIWCLLFSWLCFGVLEVLEQLNFMPEVEDLDEAALVQVASGLKSADSSQDTTYSATTAVANEVAGPAARLSIRTPLQFGKLIMQAHGPPSLRLHQQLSVYRI
jgi:hypothetical protein